jgi:hypothetical protein
MTWREQNPASGPTCEPTNSAALLEALPARDACVLISAAARLDAELIVLAASDASLCRFRPKFITPSDRARWILLVTSFGEL